jgi:hypothetical protein
MTNTLTLAAAPGRGLPGPLTIVLVVAAVAYVLWSRTQGRPLQLRRLVVVPAILAVLGVTNLTGSSAPPLTPIDIAFLVASVAVSAVLGAARGATIEIYANQGELWQRYRRSTVALWIALIATKIVLLAIASSAGASAGGGTNGLLLSLGVSLLAEAAIVGPRALSTGLPFATRHNQPSPGRSHPGPVHRLLGEAVPQLRSTENPHREAVRPQAPSRGEPGRHDRNQWNSPRRASDTYRFDRRRSHQGPIHRLLGETAARQRTNSDGTDDNARR